VRTGRWRFVLRPRWLLSHLLVIALVVVMVNLGFWQLRRLHDRRECNTVRRENRSLPASPVDSVLGPATASIDSDAYNCSGPVDREVTATGTFDTDNEVIIRSRSQDERPGAWVATPLVPDAGGEAVLVVRGFVPTPGVLDRVPADAAPPAGTVTVTGYLQASQTKGAFGPTDPSTGHLTTLARVDVARVQQQVPYRLLPAFVQLERSDPPATGQFPQPVPRIGLDEGPHLSYAVQWFLFSTIAVVGYPLILRKRARAADDDDADVDDGRERDRDPDAERSGGGAEIAVHEGPPAHHDEYA
jgi:surfeit locus 1 family protein